MDITLVYETRIRGSSPLRSAGEKAQGGPPASGAGVDGFDPHFSDHSFCAKTRGMPIRTASRVAQRYLLAKGLPMGQTYQNPKVRIHRYSDLLQVTELVNAGKRGKKCPQMAIQLTYQFKGDKPAWFERITHEFLVYSRSSDPYAKMKAFITDLQVDFPGEIDMSERDLKGVEVEPYGQVFEFKIPLEDNKSSIEVMSSPTSFRVTNHWWATGPKGNGFYQDTSYHPDKKKDAVLFYGWMKDNASKIKGFKSMDDFRKLWGTLGVEYDYH